MKSAIGEVQDEHPLLFALTILVLPLLLLFAGLAQAQSQTQTMDPTPQEILVAEEHYALAFVGRVSGQNAIFVSLSKDGQAWENANFPIMTDISFPANGGVGVCGSYDGKEITVTWNDGGKIGVLEGVLTSGGVSWAESVKRIDARQPDSAPSCVYLDNDVRIVAIRSGNLALAHTYLGQDGFFSKAVPDLFNQSTIGRPTIAAARGSAVMSWRQAREVCDQIVLAQGQIVESGPLTDFTFEKSGFLPLSSNGVTACAVNEPVISTDGKRYYVLVLQLSALPPNVASEDRLRRFVPVLYASESLDLYSGWYEYDRNLSGPNSSSKMGLASMQTGSSVFALIRRESRHNEAVATLYSDESWSTLPNSSWLGVDRFPYLEFGLARFGVHAPREFPPAGDISSNSLPRLNARPQN